MSLLQKFLRYEAEAEEMWTNASEFVRTDYGKAYLDSMVAKQRSSLGGSAGTTRPVIDAMVDALVSNRPQTRYVVEGNPIFETRAVSLEGWNFAFCFRFVFLLLMV